MKLDALRFADFSTLNKAVGDWSEMVAKLRKLKEDAETKLDAKAKKADWSGYNADVTREFIAKTVHEFADAHTQATSIHNILKDTHGELVEYKRRLNDAIARGLEKNLTVRSNPDGGFTVTMNIHPDRAAKGTEVPDHSAQDVTNLRDEIQGILTKAAESDSTAARALKALADQSPYGFSGASYADRDAAAEAQRQAEELANLIKKKGDDMSPQEFDRLNSTLARYKNDPLFQEKFATTLGPRGTMEFWADLSDGSDGGSLQRSRLNQLGDFQKNLSFTLAGATQSDSPAMRNWENEMVRLGNQQFRTRGAEVYGFQVMSNLMRVGDYDDRFLNNYGNALVETEKKAKIPGLYWQGPTKPKLNFIGDEFGRDPMTGFMHALTNSPDAATEFFATTKPQDNAEWVLKDRRPFDDTPLNSDDPYHSRKATGRALFAAGSGISDPQDPNARYVEHTEEQRKVFKRSLEHLAATGNDFPPEFRNDMARLMGNHGDTVHRAMSDPINSGSLDSGQLMEVSKQISRNQESYAILNEQMNYAILHDIHTEKEHPEDSLDRAGRTVGFLEEARYQATNDKRDGDLTDASWKKNWAYHLAGGAVTPLGGGKIGDPLQRGVDVIATAWLQEETNRINSEATKDHLKTYENRNEQLNALADEWYRVNKDWAEDPSHEGYSKDFGVYSKIGAAANDGNKKAEGVAGDQ